MHKKGFTLIELIVIIAIIGILASVIIGAIKSSKYNNNNQNNTETIKQDLTKFYENTNTELETEKNIITDEYLKNIFNEEKPCENITNLEAKTICKKELKRQENIENCIERYTNN